MMSERGGITRALQDAVTDFADRGDDVTARLLWDAIDELELRRKDLTAVLAIMALSVAMSIGVLLLIVVGAI